jgi:VanZ family protein
MLNLKYPKIFVPAAILYAILIFYLSITSDIGNIRHHVNVTLIRGIRDILIASKIPFIMGFLVNILNYIEGLSLDIGHIGIYFLFGIFLYFAFASSKKEIFEKYSAAFAICVGSAYGILNETFQLFLPYRTASITDAISNLLGLVFAQILVLTFILVLRQIQNRKRKIDPAVN